MTDQTSIFFVQSPEGRIWESTLAFDERLTKAKFAGEWLSVFKLEAIDIMHVWQIADRNGWKIREIELPEKSDA